MDIGFYSDPKFLPASPKLVYLLGADSDGFKNYVKDGTIVIYQGHHGDVGANFADLIFPGAAYTEKDSTFVNAEGRSQQTHAAVPPPVNAREDWKIIRALSEYANETLPYDDLTLLRKRMWEISPNLIQYGHRQELDSGYSQGKVKSVDKTLLAGSFRTPISDYYLTDSISRNSATMAKCSQAFTKRSQAEQ